MKTRLITGVCVLLFSTAFIGCASNNTKVEVKQINAKKFKTVELNFPKVDAVTGEEISINIDDYDLSSALQKLSGYRAYRMVKKENQVEKYRGLKIEKSDSNYLLHYVNGEKSDDWHIAEATFDIKNIEVVGNTLVFELPDDYKYKSNKDTKGLAIKPLDKLENLEIDAKNIYKKLDTIYVEINKDYNLTGEFTTQAPNKTVNEKLAQQFDVFDRSRDKALLDKTYALNYKGKKYPLHVKIDPYYGGSRVRYNAQLPYTLDSKGGCSLSKRGIAYLEKEITKLIKY